MAYHTLGYRPVLAVADTTGQNVGNWTASLDAQTLGAKTDTIEMYHLYLKAPTLATIQTTATVALNLGTWDATLIGQLNSWDPSQPMLLTPGDTIYVFFNVPTSTTPAPTVTFWFRYQT